jgi:hypothetical protein
MRKTLRTLLIGASAILAIGTLPACSSGPSTEATTSDAPKPAAAAPFPTSAKYIADMESGGKTMTIGIAVDGTEVAAYACNGTDDEAWFFGNQTDGTINIASKFRDTLNASFNGTDVKGDLTMNGVTYTFSAASVPAPAGMYTAELDGVRASWVVRPDGSAIGVQRDNDGVNRELDQSDIRQLKDAEFQSKVRNKRRLQQAQQLVAQQNKTFRSTINGHEVTPTIVNGNFRFG